MEILSLTLSNFRNFAARNFIFDPKLTVILGPNGSGKSNILEAVAFLSGIRPRPIETDLDLVRFGQVEAKIGGRVTHSTSSGSLKNLETCDLVINFQVIDEAYVKKAYFIDSIKKRFGDFRNYLAQVTFEPQDIDLVTGSPSLRRHHLDSFLASLDREYWREQTSYDKVIVRRNKILAKIIEGEAKPAELDFWDERLVEHGRYLSRTRQEFFEFLNSTNTPKPGLKDIYKPGLSGEVSSGFSWQLKQSLLNPEKLAKDRERDIAAGVTLSGPHRDDFRFTLKNHDLEFFGSRGEQRMAVLVLKLAELEYLGSKRGQRPILALDDIFSELDWEHREAVLSVVDKQQTIITAAEADSVPKKILKRAKIVELQ